ncbi:MAG: flavodoxin family protein [Kosmotogaceae bacterium]
MKIFAFNGSPRMKKGNTELILEPFLEGIRDTGCETKKYYATALDIKPCSCGYFYCWDNNPGNCIIEDDMQMLYPRLRESEILVIATPVYTKLPGDLQNFINRLLPLMNPKLEMREERTRVRLRDNVNIKKIVLVSVCGWWEMGNFETVEKIIQELSKTISVEYAGALLRPHSYMMRNQGKLTEDGKQILVYARKAGYELVSEGKMQKETLDSISCPLITKEQYLNPHN